MVAQRQVVRRLAGLAALSAWLFPQPARAQEQSVFNVGLQLGLTLEKKPRAEWGFVLLDTISTDDSDIRCSVVRSGYGGWFRVSVIGLTSPRIAFGVHAGRQSGSNAAGFMGELGGVVRADTSQFGLHSNFLGQLSNFNLYARQQWLLDTLSIGAEARLEPTFGSDCGPPEAVPGRPLRTSDGAIVTASTRPACPQNESLCAARRWEDEAQLECTSVTAFLALARDLLAVGAPDSLVERALDAAEDEMAHAVLCAHVASELSGQPAWPVLPPPCRPALSDRRRALERLAVESWLDGCLNEGVAARIAEASALSTCEPLLRDVRRRIAADEAEHAELAWQILLWAADSGGPELCARLRHDCAEPCHLSCVDRGPDLATFGLLPGEESELLAAQAVQAAQQRAAFAL